MDIRLRHSLTLSFLVLSVTDNTYTQTVATFTFSQVPALFLDCFLLNKYLLLAHPPLIIIYLFRNQNCPRVLFEWIRLTIMH